VVLVAALLLAVGGAVFWLSRPPAGPAPARPAIEEPFNEVDLGVFSRPFSTDVPGLLKEDFVLRVVLVLNPKYGDPARIRPLVERRRSKLRHAVTVDVIHARPESDLRRPAVLEDLQRDIRRRLNGELGGPRDGQDVILEVLFPEAHVPPRR
jgi:flagellar basal body-associated protein FliL